MYLVHTSICNLTHSTMLMENYDCIFAHMRIPVAPPSKARVCGRLFPVTVGSNIAGGMGVYYEC
jgi:hypothetical protein